MKKLLLLSALAFGAMTMNAQNLTVTVEGKTVEPNSTVTSTHVDPQLIQFGSLKLLPEVFVTSSESTTLNVEVINTTQPGTQVNPFLGEDYKMQFCWPVECATLAPGEAATSTGSVVAGEVNDLAVDATIVPYEEDKTYVMSCVINMWTAGQSKEQGFSFTLIMGYGDVNGVEGIVSDNSVAPVYYDLSGRQIANPEKGIFIKKQGSKVSKVVL